jgi:hypothetical protein
VQVSARLPNEGATVPTRGFRLHRLAPALILVALATAGSAWALQSLPATGAQVNDDAAAGIPKTSDVAGEDPTNADVVGGALVATAQNVPWAVFRQLEPAGAHDQVFSRSFAGGAWTTRGAGTVGGRSSASPLFTGSLNFDQAEDGEAPAIDFAGAGRTVPWATWYENTLGAGFGAEQVFASRFDVTANRWLFAGQSRGLGGGSVPVPSLNIHTDENAENPSVAGGSTSDPTKPGPWVAWQEQGATGAHTNQIFVARPVGPGSTSCTGVKPAAADPTAAPVGGFCWQQTGIERLSSDPSLNVDMGRDGDEPDIAFTGANDAVPWVVWYELGAGSGGLHSNDLVFAAKGIAPSGSPTGTVDGSLVWTAVGSAGSGVLDASAAGGPCGGSAAAEGACSLNADASKDAEDPRVAAGAMDPSAATVPWVVWDETVGATKQVFVARLVGGTHFALANNGQPISSGTGDSTRADITFSGNTPYVSWREHLASGNDVAFLGHFVNAASPTFVLDSSDTVLTPTGQADVREPISSTCTANPFNVNGAACQGGAIGTPFALVTQGASPRALFGLGYDTATPATGAATAVTANTATLTGSFEGQGAAARVSFQYGTTTGYGQTTTAVGVGAANGVVTFSAAIASLLPSTVVHYRAVVATDFQTRFGPDQTLTTLTPAPVTKPPVTPPTTKDSTPATITTKVVATALGKLLKHGRLKLTVALNEAGSARVTATITKKVKKKRHVLALGPAVTLRFYSAGSKTLTFQLSKRGKALLRPLRRVAIRFVIVATDSAGNRSSRTITTTVRRS